MNKKPNKNVIIASFLLTTARLSYATLPVVDYSHIAQDAGNEVVNLAKWVKTEVDAAQTQLNTLNTYENTVLQVARMGNPAALRALPGISTVAEMVEVYGRLSRNYATVQGLLNPQRYQNDLNYILGAYKLPRWNGFNTASGLPVLPAQGLFQFSTGSWNVANNAQQQLTMLDQQRQKLQQLRDQALTSLEAATTVSEVQKNHAALDSLNAAIAEVSQGEQELYHRTALEIQQLEAGKQIYNASQAELNRAAEMTGFDRELLSIPISMGGQ